MPGLGISIFFPIIGFIPGIVIAYIAISRYKRTGVLDYLIFAGFYLFFFVGSASFAILAWEYDILLLYKLHHWTTNIAYLMVFFHAIRIHWERVPSILWYTGILWFSMLMILIFFWEKMDQPARAMFLFWEMEGGSFYFPKGAGIQMGNGIIIYSTAYRPIGDLFRYFTVGLALYVYLKLKLLNPSKRIIRARRMWLYLWVVFLFLVNTQFIFGLIRSWVGNTIPLPEDLFSGLITFLSIFTVPLIVYISIFAPEALLLSQVQVHRAINVYQKIINLDTEEDFKKFGMQSLVEYIRNIPPELFA